MPKLTENIKSELPSSISITRKTKGRHGNFFGNSPNETNDWTFNTILIDEQSDSPPEVNPGKRKRKEDQPKDTAIRPGKTHENRY